MTARLLIAALALALHAPLAPAESARVAVAANFAGTLERLAEGFEAESPGAAIELSSGSTGKLYAQIRAGAPFDAFFSADAETAELLERGGQARPGSRFAYARGQLALWTRRADLDLRDGAALLRSDRRLRVALANPKLAPYGRAAAAFLESADLMDDLRPRLAFGENVAQAYHFAQSGAADLAFVSLAQILSQGAPPTRYWLPPIESYPPIEQQAVLLTESEAARAFLDYCRSDAGKALIRGAGYLIP